MKKSIGVQKSRATAKTAKAINKFTPSHKSMINVATLVLKQKQSVKI